MYFFILSKFELKLSISDMILEYVKVFFLSYALDQFNYIEITCSLGQFLFENSPTKQFTLERNLPPLPP
jgi:hypothetical protein